MIKVNKFSITLLPAFRKAVKCLPASPDLRVATPTNNAKMTKAKILLRESKFPNSSTDKNRTIRSPQVSLALPVRGSRAADASLIAVTGKAHNPAMVSTAAMMMVLINTIVIMMMVRPSLLLSSILAIEEDMAKNNRGITDTNNRFKKISPTGFRISTYCGVKRPIRLPMVIPNRSRMILP